MKKLDDGCLVWLMMFSATTMLALAIWVVLR